MNVGVAIQTHPLRHLMACDLARQLPGSVQVYDPKPHEHRSPWRTYRWCLERALAPTNEWTHLLVIQDDAVLCDHFGELLPRVVAAQPDALLALFVAAVPFQCSRSVEEACDRDIPFAKLMPTDWLPVVATVWPVVHIRRALDWVDQQNWRPDFTADDAIVGRIAKALNIAVYATAPSLVEHPDEAVSIAGPRPPRAGRDRNRVAHCFAGDCDLRDVDWTAGIWARF